MLRDQIDGYALCCFYYPSAAIIIMALVFLAAIRTTIKLCKLPVASTLLFSFIKKMLAEKRRHHMLGSCGSIGVAGNCCSDKSELGVCYCCYMATKL